MGWKPDRAETLFCVSVLLHNSQPAPLRAGTPLRNQENDISFTLGGEPTQARPQLDSQPGTIQAGTPMTMQGDGAGNTLRRFTLTSLAPSQRGTAMD
jgi:hypothetical protein